MKQNIELVATVWITNHHMKISPKLKQEKLLLILCTVNKNFLKKNQGWQICFSVFLQKNHFVILELVENRTKMSDSVK